MSSYSGISRFARRLLLCLPIVATADIWVPNKASATPPALVGGVNLSGLEFNAGTLPGQPNWDYPVPSDWELSYYESKNLNLIRLPVLWERLQPNATSKTAPRTLDPTYLSYITTLISEAHARNMTVIVDLHNYGGYKSHKLGDGSLSLAALRGLWVPLAKALVGLPGVAGYDLMNEPSNMPNATAWPVAAQLAVNGIRSIDKSTAIYVEGDGWASAGTWPQYNSHLHLHDVSNNLIYEAHAYGDQDNSGTHFSWAEVVAAGVTVQTMATRINVFAGWCTATHVKCMIGEVGTGNDDPNWNVGLGNGIAAMIAGGLTSFTYWAGGPWWGSYPLSIEPQNNVDAFQMSVVGLY